ncbi:MAG: type IV secretory system conjugative DNA transfer family protein [Trichococcus flocculiformis]|uniref:Type IV secretory system conjugative DNA transfer family protein n=1 Tax=Trichococcus flocculiformis TaxID=82803 RepID=A0A847D2R7_9LACT|nr:type IV secretory system conjugative DNA transfer family protein [Trichococcus flocculiformis]NLD31213.1 type IV secretory system conjugative DNA transfer family protein [Trichococcus flocculiformis]
MRTKSYAWLKDRSKEGNHKGLSAYLGNWGMIVFVGVTVFVGSAIAATFLIETITRLGLFLTAPDFQLLTGFSGVNWRTFIKLRNFYPDTRGVTWLHWGSYGLAFGVALYTMFKLRSRYGTLNRNQKGDSALATLEEISRTYTAVPEKKKEWDGLGGTLISRVKDTVFVDESTQNTAIIGTSRSGKGELLVFPMIDINSRASAKPNLVINDPKGELYTASYETLRKRGYRVEVLNILNPTEGRSYNPLELVKQAFEKGDYAEAQKRTKTLTFSLYNNPNAKEPFWDNSAQALVSAIILALCEEYYDADNYHPERITLKNVASFLSEMGSKNYSKDGGKTEVNALDEYFEGLPPTSVAKQQYATSNFAKVNTRGSIFSVASSKLEIFTGDAIAKLTSINSIDMTRVGFPKQIHLRTDIRLKGQDFEVLFYQKNQTQPFGKEIGRVEAVSGPTTQCGLLHLHFDYVLADGDRIQFVPRDNPDQAVTYSFQRVSKGHNQYGKEEFEDFAHMQWCEDVSEKERAIQSLEVLYITDSYAVFMVVPDYDSSMHVICSIFVRQIYQTLSQLATITRGQKLHRRVQFILDEFGNMPPIEGMDSMLTVCLGRNILFALVVQGYNQIDSLYGKDKATSIKDNCQNHLYIFTTNKETAKEISEKIGYRTIEIDSRSGKVLDLDSTRTTSVDRQPLLSENRLMQLQEGEMVVIRSIMRRDKKGRDIRPKAIFNTGKTRMKYRYQYLAEDFDTEKDRHELRIPSLHAELQLYLLQMDYEELQNPQRMRISTGQRNEIKMILDTVFLNGTISVFDRKNKNLSAEEIKGLIASFVLEQDKVDRDGNRLTVENIAYDIQNILKGKPLEYIDLDSLLEEEDFEEMDFDEQYIKPENKKQKIALGLRTET